MRRAFTLVELLVVIAVLVLLVGLVAGGLKGCGELNPAQPPKATTGVEQVKADISTGSDGLTAEQRNVKRRLELDNKPGAIKHLYILNSFTNDVVLYSTVKGKVTSSGKRLTPRTVAAGQATSGTNNSRYGYGVPVNIGGANYRTNEVLQDDGTHGSSIEYLYWWDANDVYHQHYVGNEMLHISDQPLDFGKPPLVVFGVQADDD